MSKADVMFEKLGYKKVCDNKEIVLFVKNCLEKTFI